MLKQRFEEFLIPCVLEAEEGPGGLTVLRLTAGKAVCRVFLMGAHVSSYLPDGREDILWMSPYTRYEPGVPLRGGIPLCFPWFGPHRHNTSLPLHGFVRTREWHVSTGYCTPDGRTHLELFLEDDRKTRKVWPYRFRLQLNITVGPALALELRILNRGTDPFHCEDGFHTYFSVSHPFSCAVLGLEGIEYLDRMKTDARNLQTGILHVNEPLVYAFMGVPESAVLVDKHSGKQREIHQSGMGAVVVWNPGEAMALENPEILDAWDRFLCVESANCLEHTLTLPGGGEHRSRLELGPAWLPENGDATEST